MHAVDPRDGGNTILYHEKARRRKTDDMFVPLETPFRMITWAALKLSSQASQFFPVPNTKKNTSKILARPFGLAFQLCGPIDRLRIRCATVIKRRRENFGIKVISLNGV